MKYYSQLISNTAKQTDDIMNTKSWYIIKIYSVTTHT